MKISYSPPGCKYYYMSLEQPVLFMSIFDTNNSSSGDNDADYDIVNASDSLWG